MKAVQVTGYGDMDKLKVVDMEIPKPKEGEVLIKVKACGINNTEIWMREGAYGADSESGWKEEGVKFPRVPGSDITGVVVEIGRNVDESLMGRSVVLFPFTSSGPEGTEHYAEDLSFIGSEYDGGYAEYVVWPAELCYEMPLTGFTESAVFSVSGLTAWHMVEQVKPKSSETVLVTGANGGVGSMAVQIASRIHGVKVIALVGNMELKDRMMELGATHVISYRSERLVEDILKISGGPVDSVLDVVGDALFKTVIRVLKRGGKLCISGSIGGQTTHVDLRDIYLKHLTVYGSVLGTRSEFKDMLEAIKKGLLKPVIDRTFPLEHAAEAQTYFKSSGKVGKIVLIPEEKDR